MVEMKLGGMTVLVDDDDIHFLSMYTWYPSERKHGFYVQATAPGQVSLLLHRLILGLEIGDKRQVDHINHNGLDNRRVNLRICSRSQNLGNSRKPRKSTTSRFKGVSFDRSRNLWRAAIGIGDNRTKQLGRFAVEEDAARAYNAAAKERWGVFAHLNEI